ncbi:MAG TPA: tetratricopeptide repeat protein [Myxococcales bacterium]|nr:tetratricopeptide repeat protein [Myxococcales bacterium]
MAGWMQFSLLWWITGNPLAAAVLLLLGYAVADWYTFGFLRGLARALRNLRRAPHLARQIAVNPHDRRARVELGEILVEQGRFARAIDVLRPAAQQDPHDLSALYPLGIACLRNGRVEEGELFLRELHGADPELRLGRAPLEIGADRLRRGDAKGAIGPLSEYVAAHPHRVEGHYLLSRALRRSDDPAGAESARRRAWEEYDTALPYQRRIDRRWAWRARPSRPLLYGAAACAAVLLLATAVRRVPPPVVPRGAAITRGAAANARE